MTPTVALIGFGEAARAFADVADWRANAMAFDIATDDPRTAAAKKRDYAVSGVTDCASFADALTGAGAVLSLVTADQALAAARSAAHSLTSGTLYCDMNSVAPATKRAAAAIIDAVGGRYVDVTVTAPFHPTGLRHP